MMEKVSRGAPLVSGRGMKSRLGGARLAATVGEEETAAIT